METLTHILFYSHQSNKIGSYMSNFWPCIFVDTEGRQYNCSEQYFMFKKAQLFNENNTELLNAIILETDPKKIKAYGKKVKNFNEDIWNQNKRQIMWMANYYKFTQNDDLKEKLLLTDNKILIEASPYDSIWGAGAKASDIIANNYSYRGENLLGETLMILRSNLRENY